VTAERLLNIPLILPSEGSVSGQAGDGCDCTGCGCWEDEEGMGQRKTGKPGSFIARLNAGRGGLIFKQVPGHLWSRRIGFA